MCSLWLCVEILSKFKLNPHLSPLPDTLQSVCASPETKVVERVPTTSCLDSPLAFVDRRQNAAKFDTSAMPDNGGLNGVSIPKTINVRWCGWSSKSESAGLARSAFR